MKAYLTFGDWSGDGHKFYEEILVEINSMEDISNAQKLIRKKYGDNFFKEFANEYQNSQLSKTNWQALIDTHMPISILQVYDECNNWSDCKSIEEIFDLPKLPHLDLNFIIQAFIWLMNSYEANIKKVPIKEHIPQINAWTCPGFETIGYGCFD